MKKILFVFILILLVLPMIRADVITPGEKPIQVNNIVTNIQDFPDYVFISGFESANGPPLNMCPVHIIESSGEIGGYYKLCSVSVYAIKKSSLNQTLLDKLTNYTEINKMNYSDSVQLFNDLIKDSNAIMIIKGISVYQTVPDTSTQNNITNYYTIDINKLKDAPDNKVVARNNLIYWYIGIPILALIIIISIILLRRK